LALAVECVDISLAHRATPSLAANQDVDREMLADSRFNPNVSLSWPLGVPVG
jgi:hypothetical protein